MLSVLTVYAGVVALGAGAGVLAAFTLALLWVSRWIEAHSRSARRIGIRYAWTQVALVLLFYVTGHMPLSALALCALATAHHLYVLAPEHWPARAEGRGGVQAIGPLLPSYALPLMAHVVITSHHTRSARAWARHAHMGGAAPETPPASSLEVVALLAGVVWTLPVWLFLGENALEWSLPVGAASRDAPSARS